MVKELTKHDQGKLPMSLIDPYFLKDLAKVLQYGAQKYEPNNWRKGGPWSRVSDAAERHILEWKMGIDTDPESGLPHLVHAACNLMFLHYFTQNLIGTDDRWDNLDPHNQQKEDTQ